MSKVGDSLNNAIAVIGEQAEQIVDLKTKLAASESVNASLTSQLNEAQSQLSDGKQKNIELEQLLADEGATPDQLAALDKAIAGAKAKTADQQEKPAADPTVTPAGDGTPHGQ